jgi:hypothetical protein
MKIEEYIDAHCVGGTPKVGIQLPIQEINDLSLKIIVLVLDMITGLATFHQASRPLMFYAMQCMRPTVYDLMYLTTRKYEELVDRVQTRK